MTFRTLLSSLAAGASLAVHAPAQADASAPRCFANHRLGTVSAYHRPAPQAHGYDEQLAGARVFVYAEPGLTAEWLHYSLEQQRSPGSACPADVPGARISVQSGGPGFWVTLSSENGAVARQILERAQRLERR